MSCQEACVMQAQIYAAYDHFDETTNHRRPPTDDAPDNQSMTPRRSWTSDASLSGSRRPSSEFSTPRGSHSDDGIDSAANRVRPGAPAPKVFQAEALSSLWEPADTSIPTDAAWAQVRDNFQLAPRAAGRLLSGAYQSLEAVGAGCHAEVVAVQAAGPAPHQPMVCKHTKPQSLDPRQTEAHRAWVRRHGLPVHQAREVVLLLWLSAQPPGPEWWQRLGVCPVADVLLDDHRHHDAPAGGGPPVPCVVMPRFENTLASCLHEGRHRQWRWDFCAVVLDQIFQAVAGLHAQGIAHRDLKPRNLLVGRSRGPGEGAGSPSHAFAWRAGAEGGADLFPLVVLADFGAARWGPPAAPRTGAAAAGHELSACCCGAESLPRLHTVFPCWTGPAPPGGPPPASYPVTTPCYEGLETSLLGARRALDSLPSEGHEVLQGARLLAGDVWALGMLVLDVVAGKCATWDRELATLPHDRMRWGVLGRQCALLYLLLPAHVPALRRQLDAQGLRMEALPGWSESLARVSQWLVSYRQGVQQKLPYDTHGALHGLLLGLLHPCPHCRWDLPTVLRSAFGQQIHAERLRHHVQRDATGLDRLFEHLQLFRT